jgi:hypothetical protein
LRASGRVATLGPSPPGTAAANELGEVGMYEERSGWVTFAAVLLLLGGALSVIYGIAAIGNSKFFTQNAQYIFSSLKTWGWITLFIGILQLLAGGSLWRGGLYGRIFAIAVASLSAIGALLSLPAYPFWSLAVFALDIVIIHQVAAHGTEGRGAAAEPSVGSDMTGMAQYRQ